MQENDGISPGGIAGMKTNHYLCTPKAGTSLVGVLDGENMRFNKLPQ